MPTGKDAPLAFELAALVADALEDGEELGGFAHAAVVLLEEGNLAGVPGVIVTLADGRSFQVTVTER